MNSAFLLTAPAGRRARAAGAALALASSRVIASRTLVPPDDESAGPTLCLLCGERGLADALLNVLMVVPLGIGLALGGAGLLGAALFGCVFTGGIEFLQALIPGRDASVSDLVFNTLGCVVGAALVHSAPAWIHPPPARGGRFLAAGLAAPLLLLLAAGLMLGPRPSRDTYAGQWTAELGHLQAYRGRVVAAYVGDLPVPSRQMPAESGRLRVLVSEGAPIRVAGVAGPPVSGLAPIFSIYDDEDREILLLGTDGEDAVFQYRTLGMALRMDRPGLRLPGAFRGIPEGAPLRMGVVRRGRGYCIAVNSTSSCSVGYTVADTWGVLLALFSLEGARRGLLGLVWLAALFVPAGWWLRTRRDVLPAGAAVVAGLLLVPWAAGLLATPPAQLLAALSGVGAGALLRRAAATLGRSPVAPSRMGRTDR
ncbi:MAG TPA: VanZ family protein [Longimicrobiaceae bacterium]|nr:VanZ family protein [Longimicrobiaceae bacterium]